MRLYVGNLPYQTSEDDLGDIFGAYGEVESVAIISARETGRSRGFGFVAMVNPSEGKAAIDALHESDLGGRSLVVNEARPRQDRGRR